MYLYPKVYIQVNHQKISLEAIQKNIFDSASLSCYALHSIQFIQDWMNGQQHFTVYTSGSTGLPKSMLIARSQMITSVYMTAQALKLSRGSHALICLNTQYIAGIMMLVRALVLKLSITIVDPTSNPLHSFNDSVRFDFIAMVPMQLYTILKAKGIKKNILNHAHAILIGGAPISIYLENAIQAIKSPVFATFGMTETVSHIALRRLNGAKKSKYYHVLSQVIATADALGRLVVSGPMTNHQTITTNDLVQFKDKQTFTWIGRYDNVLNSGGYKIQLDFIAYIIDFVLYNMDISKFFFVKGVRDELLGTKVALFFEGKALSLAYEQRIYNKLKEKLHRYEVPKNIYYISKFPLTKNGKILGRLP